VQACPKPSPGLGERPEWGQTWVPGFTSRFSTFPRPGFRVRPRGPGPQPAAPVPFPTSPPAAQPGAALPAATSRLLGGAGSSPPPCDAATRPRLRLRVTIPIATFMLSSEDYTSRRSPRSRHMASVHSELRFPASPARKCPRWSAPGSAGCASGGGSLGAEGCAPFSAAGGWVSGGSARGEWLATP
jgi:hypothetical protein